MDDTDPLDDERQHYEEFSRRKGQPCYRQRLEALYAHFSRFNAEFFFGQLKRPHIAIGVTPSRKVWCFRPATGNGAPVQFLLHERLLFPAKLDRKKEWVVAEGPGSQSLVTDGLLAMMVQQHVWEVEGVSEKGYRWYGPRFAFHANRIAPYLGVTPVAHRRTLANEGVPLAPCWPVGVRPEGFYGQDITPALLDLVCGARSARTAALAVPPGLGIWDYVLLLIAEGKIDRLRALARFQAGWIEKLRTRRFPLLKAVEDGEQDPDGTPIPEGYQPVFEPRWLSANNGIAAKMIEAIDACRTYHEMPILADALEDAGCDDLHVLRHLRGEMEHSSSCWVMAGLAKAADSVAADSAP